MNLQPKRESITVQREFLNTTQGLIHKVGGITLGAGFTGDASGYLKAGSAVVVGASGVAVAFDGVATGTPFITANDVKAEEGQVVGALESAFLNEAVVTSAEAGRVVVTQAFIDASNGRFHLR
jgi:hypothetical protein